MESKLGCEPVRTLDEQLEPESLERGGRGLGEQLCRGLLVGSALSQGLGESLDARRQPVGVMLQTIVRHGVGRFADLSDVPAVRTLGAQMRPILLTCALLALLALPAAAAARSSGAAGPGYLVVRRGVSDGGVNGRPVATVVVRGFVLGRVSQEAEVDVFHLQTASGQGAPQVKGDVSVTSVRSANGLPGKRYTGSNFRFRAAGGYYRVVVRGAGVYLFAGGRGRAWLRGSSANPRTDGTYSVDGSSPRSLPTGLIRRQIGRR
jgi:hypothetical protein